MSFDVLAALGYGINNPSAPNFASAMQQFQQQQRQQAVQQTQQSQLQKVGTWQAVNSFNEATLLSAPMDGTPLVCISPNEGRAYFVSVLNNGVKDVSTFKLIPEVQQSATPPAQKSAVQNQPQEQISQDPLARIEQAVNNLSSSVNNISSRLQSVENFNAYMRQALGEEGGTNESVTTINQS